VSETDDASPGVALDPQQVDGVLDMEPERFRVAGHAVVDLIADYLAGVESYAVLPAIEAHPLVLAAYEDAPRSPIGAYRSDTPVPMTAAEVRAVVAEAFAAGFDAEVR